MPEQSNGEQYQNLTKKFYSLNTTKKVKDQKKKELDQKTSNYSDRIDQKESQYKKKFESFAASGRTTIKKYQELPKTQLNSLIDLTLSTLDSETNSDVSREIRTIFINTIKNTRERVKKLLQEEIVKTLGCSQEQEYLPTTVYISVQSIDIFGKTLQYSPDTKPGVYLYENKEFSPRVKPYSFNRELYHRIQNEGVSYLEEYDIYFQGQTNQKLFDITYVTNDGNKDGNFYKIDFQERATGYKVVDFIGDYFSSIDVINIKDAYTNVFNALTGAISIQKGFSSNEEREQKKWELIIQKILGLCFDNRQEIDVSGTGKLDPSDQVDENFLRLDDIDNLIIDQKLKNYLLGVIEFVGCEGIKLPTTSPLLVNLLDPFLDDNLITSDPTFLAENMLDSLADNPEWKAKVPNLSFIINKEFMNVAINAILNTILSPKHLFPLVVMEKVLKQNFQESESIERFVAVYKKFLINLASKISSIFVEELVKQIRKNFRRIVQDIVNGQIQELVRKRKKTVGSILASLNIGLTLANAIQDFRRCQSVIDELERLLNLSIYLFRRQPTTINPIWNKFASTKAGMTTASMMAKYIEFLEDSGIDTGDAPDGTPNKGLFAQQNAFEALLDEIAENGKASVAISQDDILTLSSGTPTAANPTGKLLNLFGNLE